MSDKDNKTEEPTEKHLREAQDKGQFARAEELSVVFILMAIFTVFLFAAKDKAIAVAEYTRNLWLHFAEFDYSETEFHNFLNQFMYFGTTVALPFLGTCFLAVIIAGGLQSGFKIAPKALKLHWDRIDPSQGIKHIFSSRKLVEMFVDGLKLLAIAWVIYGAFQEIRQDPIFYTTIPTERIPEIFLRIILLFLSRLIFILGFIALLKYGYERHKTHQDLMMTREEVKEERKQSFGSPEIKMAQKRLAQRLTQKQMMDQVPTADVIVTNPTHYAVALKYERGKDKAPIILAKGENLFAQRIKAIGRNYEVPTVENRLAARLLYRLGNVGKPIPLEVYELVAEILAFVYRTHKHYFYELKRRRLENENLQKIKTFN